MEGYIEEVDGVLKITAVRIRYRFIVPPGKRKEADRALEVYWRNCPAYQTVKDCIRCVWEAEVEEETNP